MRGPVELPSTQLSVAQNAILAKGTKGGTMRKMPYITRVMKMSRIRCLRIVRRQGFWNQWQLKLRECSAHLGDLIMRRAVCDASAALRVSYV